MAVPRLLKVQPLLEVPTTDPFSTCNHFLIPGTNKLTFIFTGNASTGERHHLLRIQNKFLIFFSGNDSLKTERFNEEKKKILNFFSFFFALKLSESLCLIPSRYLLPLLMTSFFSKGNKNKKSLYFEFLKVTYISSSVVLHTTRFLNIFFPRQKLSPELVMQCARLVYIGLSQARFDLPSVQKNLKKISQKNQDIEFKYRERSYWKCTRSQSVKWKYTHSFEDFRSEA